MKSKKLISLILILLGVGLIGTSMYITSEVEKGKGKIARAQHQVDQGGSLLSLTPVTKEIGDELTGGAQKKIDEGKQQVAHYEGIAQFCRVGGIVLLVIGAGFFFCCKKKGK